MCLPPQLCLGKHWAQPSLLGHDPDPHMPCQDSLHWHLATVWEQGGRSSGVQAAPLS